MSEPIENAERQPSKDSNKAGSDEGKGKVKFESSMPREEAVAYFEALLSGLKQGRLHFKQGDKTLAIAPSDQLEVEVKASRKGQREKVSFELSWERSERDLVASDD